MKPAILQGSGIQERIEVELERGEPILPVAGFSWGNFGLTLLLGVTVGVVVVFCGHAFRSGGLFTFWSKLHLVLGALAITLLSGMIVGHGYFLYLKRGMKRREYELYEKLRHRVKGLQEILHQAECRIGTTRRGSVVALQPVRRQRSESISLLRRLTTAVERRFQEVDEILASGFPEAPEEAFMLLTEKYELRTNVVDPVLDTPYVLAIRAEEVIPLITGLVTEIESFGEPSAALERA